METLGQRIKRLREQRRWSQSDLGDLLGVSMRTVSNWERDKNHPRNRMGALEELFETKLDEVAEAIEAAAASAGDPVVTAVQRSRLTEDRQYDVIGYYKKRLREQDYEDERRGA